MSEKGFFMCVLGEFFELGQDGFDSDILRTAKNKGGINEDIVIFGGYCLVLGVNGQFGLYDVKDLATADLYRIFRIIQEQYSVHPTQPLMNKSLWCLQQ